ncbi:MAG: PPOX class F420-dependent oxidoreductase, partial [Jatrophihabitantaceae bacterium]
MSFSIEEIEPVADRAKRYADTGVVPWAAGRYMALTSYRRDGDPVVTPVWFVTYEGRLWLWTDAASGKVKRIRNSPSCSVAPCTMSGRITGAALPGQAWLVPVEHCVERVQSMICAKYPFQKRALDIFSP